MDRPEFRLVTGKTKIIKDYVTREKAYKYQINQVIKRSIYKAHLLECGHSVEIAGNENAKKVRCVQCWDLTPAGIQSKRELRRSIDRVMEEIKQEEMEEEEERAEV